MRKLYVFYVRHYDGQLHRKVKAAAAKKGVTMGEFVIQALRKAVKS